MDWLNCHHLLNYWLVARKGSVQRTSEVLHVTPASVSVQVRQLEHALGVKLVQKQGRGLALTDTGQQVADYAGEISFTGRVLIEMVKGRPFGRPMDLRVGIREVIRMLVAFQLPIPTAHGLQCAPPANGRLVQRFEPDPDRSRRVFRQRDDENRRSQR